jgi:RNA polymerase sigma-70 factor (ECF subfamily)
MAAARSRGRGDPRYEELVSAFVDAARSGDLEALMSMLAEDARLVAFGGGKVQAALNVIEGADSTARFIIGAVTRSCQKERRCASGRSMVYQA